ncbi:phenylacetate--CoA ligase family protein [Pseudothauera nasutitermitis]|uniref:Phenylacetate--CoA ligase family protein n=1 Tax=Pseudothauera nasutitermitis TaxID=2565930 RepID=A0A4S4AWL3_9RHOO|nr:AMP-binding protein [Pseudothauera nasutitermitis]THF63655.1 phenylacetate--CoA ligase family protein [Pseudothauera nasutitermitis]
MSASLYTRLVSGLLFPLHERLKGHGSVRARRALEDSQWWPRERIEALRVARLRALLVQAGTHVPYYREVFARIGFDPRELHTLADLRALPLLTKALVREHVDALRADDARALARFNTGGSSGEPLVFYIGRERVERDVAAKWRATRWWGVDIGDPEIVVWGSPIELGAQDRLRALRDRVLRTELLPAFDMSAARLDEFVARIRARRPAMLFGYPSALCLIARHAEQRGQRLDDLGVRVVFVTSERLYDHQRETLQRLFGCPVANGYGGRDAGFIAHQCPAGGMHLSAEDVVVEILDGEGRVLPHGEAGEIVVTHLATRDFPFIRYRTGDVGVLDDAPCACGRGLPLLREIQGRSTDFVVAADGTVMHGLSLIYILRDLPGVRAFKVVQEALDRVRVLVVPGEGFGESGRRAIDEGFRRRLGQGVTVQVEEVGEIPAERSGKFRYIVSKVAPSAGGAAAA